MVQRLRIIFTVSSLAALTIASVNLHAQYSLQIDFVKIPAGEFMMGCSSGDAMCGADENPRHRVQITKSFEMGKYEITQAQWFSLMQTNPSMNKGDNRPVEMVGKLDIQEFIAKLNSRNDGYRYRLPTEAEWEYAARAGKDSANTGPIEQVAWFEGNSEDESHPVGQKRPNAWGLYDMQGNVREYVSDFYSGDYYSVSPAIDPTGPQLTLGGRGSAAPIGRGFQGGPGPGGGAGAVPPSARGIAAGASLQDQVNALQAQVDDLQRQLQQLRSEFESGPRGRGGFGPGGPGVPGGPGGPAGPGVFGPGGPAGPGRGPQQGPVVLGPDGQFIDPLDGLPTGLPVIRGGGWDQSAEFQRVSARYSYYGPTLKLSDIGFRVVREPLSR